MPSKIFLLFSRYSNFCISLMPSFSLFQPLLEINAVENAVITIGLVMLFLWKLRQAGCGPVK